MVLNNYIILLYLYLPTYYQIIMNNYYTYNLINRYMLKTLFIKYSLVYVYCQPIPILYRSVDYTKCITCYIIIIILIGVFKIVPFNSLIIIFLLIIDTYPKLLSRRFSFFAYMITYEHLNILKTLCNLKSLTLTHNSQQ